MKAGAVSLDQKSADLVVFILDLSPDHGHVRNGARSDPHFFAVEDVLFSDFAGAGAHAAGIGAKVGLGEAEAAQLIAFLQRRKPCLFLLFAAKCIDRIHDQRGLHADKRTYARITAFQLLHHQTVFDIRHSRATVAFQAGAVKAEIGHRLHQFARETSGAVAFFNDGNEIVFDKLAGGIANQPLVVAEQRVESDEVYSSEFQCHENSLSIANG